MVKIDQSHIPECTIQNRNVHICVLNGALWDMEQVNCGICKLGQVDTKLLPKQMLSTIMAMICIMSPKQNDRHFVDDILKCNLLKGKSRIWIQISLNIVSKV